MTCDSLTPVTFILSNCSCFVGTRLKFGDGFQYTLNTKGSTPAEVMGIDYKSALKPALESFAEDIKKNSMAKLEELIALQQQSSDIAAKVEGKRNHLARLESHTNEVSAPKLAIDRFLGLIVYFMWYQITLFVRNAVVLCKARGYHD